MTHHLCLHHPLSCHLVKISSYTLLQTKTVPQPSKAWRPAHRSAFSASRSEDPSKTKILSPETAPRQSGSSATCILHGETQEPTKKSYIVLLKPSCRHPSDLFPKCNPGKRKKLGLWQHIIELEKQPTIINPHPSWGGPRTPTYVNVHRLPSVRGSCYGIQGHL